MYAPGQQQLQSASWLQNYSEDRPSFQANVRRTLSSGTYQVFVMPQGLLFLELRHKLGCGGNNNNNAVVIGAVMGGMIGACVGAAIAGGDVGAGGRIENFEGPLDLLLHLIKKNEINIYDIPIALIAQQYLEYLEAMTELNLNVAGDFLVMAATLLQIKSKMLLPVDESSEDEEEGPDPREELVRRLLEYKMYKEAARQLDGQEKMWRDIFSRDPAPTGSLHADETPLENVSLFDLVDALKGVLDRNQGKQLLEITPDNLTVRDRMNVILELLEGNDSVAFADLFESPCHRLVVIVTLLPKKLLVAVSTVPPTSSALPPVASGEPLVAAVAPAPEVLPAATTFTKVSVPLAWMPPPLAVAALPTTVVL